jgi:hypothetical protein
MGRKRKNQEEEGFPNKKANNTMEEEDNNSTISPSSKIQTLKIDVVSCNGQAIHQSTELGAVDLENIWTQSLGRKLEEVCGYTSLKNKSGEIRIQYQLKRSMSIKEIIKEQEFVYERSTVFATDNFKCKAVGLNEVRLAKVGETVKVTVNLPNFDITVAQIVEWISKFGKIKDGHRY